MTKPTDIRPPFTPDTALAKVQAAEDAWNSRDPKRVATAYSEDSEWRNRSQFVQGRDAIQTFLANKWSKELDYRLVKSLWTFSDDRIAVRFQYEYHDDLGQWFRAYGNELWEFDKAGLMRRREASINDLAIEEHERRLHWPAPAQGGKPIQEFRQFGRLRRPYLEDAEDPAPLGTVHLTTRYRDTNTNLRSTFQKIISRAGHQPWPRLFQKLRAARETELMAKHPAKDVAAWLHNSVPVAMPHYAMATAESFERAIQERSTPQPRTLNGANSDLAETGEAQPEAQRGESEKVKPKRPLTGASGPNEQNVVLQTTRAINHILVAGT